jgi:hypothetical protein
MQADHDDHQLGRHGALAFTMPSLGVVRGNSVWAREEGAALSFFSAASEGAQP